MHHGRAKCCATAEPSDATWPVQGMHQGRVGHQLFSIQGWVCVPAVFFGLAALRPYLDCLEVFVCLPQNSHLPGYSLSTEAGSLLYVRWLFIMHKIGVFITPNFIIKTHFYAFKKP